MPYLLFNRNLFFKKVNIRSHNVLQPIKSSRSKRILLAKIWDNGLMNLQSYFFLNLRTNWPYNLVSKRLVNFFFVVINGNIWLFKVLNVPKHFNGVSYCHQEVIQLIWSFDVRHDHIEYKGKQHSHPINKPASACFFDYFLPIRNYFKSRIQKKYLLQLLWIENLGGH